MEPFWELPWGEQPRFGEAAWECDPREAQRYLNFPLLMPARAGMPEGLTLSALTVRPEGPSAWSSARLVLAGAGRRLRLKQYFFDWWRPTELALGFQRTLGFYRAGDAVVAWGRDLRGRAAARMAWGRTTVDLRIERGAFVEWELRQLFSNLEPASPEALTLLVAPPYYRISYHVRRGRGPGQLDELASATWQRLPEFLESSPVPPLLPRTMPPGWTFDSGGIWPDPPPRESQWLLRDLEGQIVLYARARPSDDPQPLRLPAIYRPQEGWRARQAMVRRRRATIAMQHPDLGGWSAAWAESGQRYQLFVRAGALPGEGAFRDLLEGLAPVDA